MSAGISVFTTQSAPLLRGDFASISLGAAAAPQFVDAAWRKIDYCVDLRVKPQIHTLEYTLQKISAGRLKENKEGEKKHPRTIKNGSSHIPPSRMRHRIRNTGRGSLSYFHPYPS